MMMVVAPETVKHDRLPRRSGLLNGDPRKAFPAVQRFNSFKELTPSGVVGDARRANADRRARSCSPSVSAGAGGCRPRTEELGLDARARDMVENRPLRKPVLPHLILWIGIVDRGVSGLSRLRRLDA